MRGGNSSEGSGPGPPPFLVCFELPPPGGGGGGGGGALNLVETLVAETHQLRAENQRLRMKCAA